MSCRRALLRAGVDHEPRRDRSPSSAFSGCRSRQTSIPIVTGRGSAPNGQSVRRASQHLAVRCRAHTARDGRGVASLIVHRTRAPACSRVRSGNIPGARVRNRRVDRTSGGRHVADCLLPRACSVYLLGDRWRVSFGDRPRTSWLGRRPKLLFRRGMTSNLTATSGQSEPSRRVSSRVASGWPVLENPVHLVCTWNIEGSAGAEP